MNQNQKFALLVFALVLLAVVVGTWVWVNGQTNAML
jgi:flagellar biosynthesis/type III secretory pathway M-ring protein FliF/YscJ